MPITRDDVARLAGVSSATVSYVINNGPKQVADPTRQRVLQAIERLGYRPSSIARSLKTRKTTTLGVIVADILNPILSAIAKGVEDAIVPWNYNMILCNSDEDPGRELMFLNMLLAKQVDGVLLMPTGENKGFLFSLVDQRKLPMVLLDREMEGLKVSTFLFDNEDGAYQATRHLIELGHRRIGLVSLPRSLTPGRDRALGYDRALREAGIPYHSSLVAEGDFKAENAASLTHTIFSSQDRPTALLVGSNRLLSGVLQYAKEKHLKIPQDLAVAVFDDAPYYSFITPSITAVRVDANEFGRQAANLLQQQIDQEQDYEPKTVYFPVELMVRESTVGIETGEPLANYSFHTGS